MFLWRPGRRAARQSRSRCRSRAGLGWLGWLGGSGFTGARPRPGTGWHWVTPAGRYAPVKKVPDDRGSARRGSPSASGALKQPSMGLGLLGLLGPGVGVDARLAGRMHSPAAWSGAGRGRPNRPGSARSSGPSRLATQTAGIEIKPGHAFIPGHKSPRPARRRARVSRPQLRQAAGRAPEGRAGGPRRGLAGAVPTA